MLSTVQPYQWVAIRLPSDTIKVEQMIPNSTISLGKFGSFKTNQIINRPFHLTWEILDKSESRDDRDLRVVKASELHADTLLEEAESDLIGDITVNSEFNDYELPTTEKSNVNIFDDPANQKLTTRDIELLKSDDLFNPKQVIAKIMASHATLDQKTAFSLAKYTLRKQKKYMKRFAILPLDVAMMADWMMLERDLAKVMEIRNEALGLIGSWANVHAAGIDEAIIPSLPRCRYLVVDDTGGLVVAALAERMGILHHHVTVLQHDTVDSEEQDVDLDTTGQTNRKPAAETPPEPRKERQHENRLPNANTIHLIHSNTQPNLSLLRYFNFDPNIQPSVSDTVPCHPLHTHLKPVSWLQVIDPEADSAYQEPTARDAKELQSLKSNARSTYYRKRRRWARCKTIVDEVRNGGFNCLVIATYTNLLSVLARLVPLLAGGAQIVLYHPHPEPLAEVADAYSTARRTAFLNLPDDEREQQLGGPKFPVDPTLVLGLMLQTARVKKWQVLPGRTHPLMMARGGAEGYIAVGTRVLPVKGKITARGNQVKRGKRRDNDSESAYTSDILQDIGSDVEIESQNMRKRKKIEAENGLSDAEVALNEP